MQPCSSCMDHFPPSSVLKQNIITYCILCGWIKGTSCAVKVIQHCCCLRVLCFTTKKLIQNTVIAWTVCVLYENRALDRCGVSRHHTASCMGLLTPPPCYITHTALLFVLCLLHDDARGMCTYSALLLTCCLFVLFHFMHDI